MKNYLVLLLLLLVSCNDEVLLDTAGSIAAEAGNPTEEVDLSDPTDGVDLGDSPDVVDSGGVVPEPDNEEDEAPESKESFVFNKLTGECANAEGELGLNRDKFEECGDLSERVLEGMDFSKKGYFGLNINGSEISKSKMKYRKIADHEVLYDEFTLFDKNNSFTKLFDQHSGLVNRQQSLIEKLQIKIKKKKAHLNVLKTKYVEAKSEKRKEKIEKTMIKVNDQITNLVKRSNIAMKKKFRHTSFTKKTYVLAQTEPAYTRMKIKNKKWLELDGKKGAKVDSANNLFKDAAEFSASIWFRTTENQEDKRLFNFNHNGSQSGLLLTVKKGKIVLGFRNESSKYITLEHSKVYTDNNWHNAIGTYDGKTFKLFVNGELVKSQDSSFAGFGDKETNLGSYQGRSNFFNGDLDEASIWSEALTEASVDKIYNDGIPTKLNRHPSSGSLLKWWRMGDKNNGSTSGDLL